MTILKSVGFSEWQVTLSQISNMCLAVVCLILSYALYNLYMSSRKLGTIWGLLTVFFVMLFAYFALELIKYDYVFYKQSNVLVFGMSIVGTGALIKIRKFIRYFQDQELIMEKLMQRETQVRTLVSRSILEYKNHNNPDSEWLMKRQLELREIDSLLSNGDQK